jgi:hypothetical protein
MFLISHTGTDHFFILAYRAYTLPAGPKVSSGKTLLDAVYCTLNVVGHGVALDKLHFVLATQLSDDLSNLATEAAIKFLLMALRDDHHMVFALPFNMG